MVLVNLKVEVTVKSLRIQISTQKQVTIQRTYYLVAGAAADPLAF